MRAAQCVGDVFRLPHRERGFAGGYSQGLL